MNKIYIYTRKQE